jgi:hypothetical protein
MAREPLEDSEFHKVTMLTLLAQARKWLHPDEEDTQELADQIDAVLQYAKDEWEGSECFQCGCAGCEYGREDYRNAMAAIRAARGLK